MKKKNLPKEVALIAVIMGDNVTKKLYESSEDFGYINCIDTIAQWAIEFEKLYRNTNWEEFNENPDKFGFPSTKVACWDDAVIYFAEQKLKPYIIEPKLDYDQWAEQYKPCLNNYNPNAPHNGYMYETFGEELNHINRVKPEHVWTLLDCDGREYIAKGVHIVNRMGYFITQYPWNEQTPLDFPVLTNEEHAELENNNFDNIIHLSLRSDLEGNTDEPLCFIAEGKISNEPETWAIDGANIEESYLYESKTEYQNDVCELVNLKLLIS